MCDVAVTFTDVSFGFRRGKPLFNRLTVDLGGGTANGKIVALMGPNGIGKSTFCHLVLGTRRPDSGSIKSTPAQPRVAAIPQKGVVFDELSVLENISCLKYSTTLRRTFQLERVSKAVEALGLKGVVEANTPSSEISGGEAQRVMLARVQTVDCDLLVLDEPCSSLDNQVKGTFLDALRATVDAGRILALMVTHVWDEAQMVADELIFFHRTGDGTVSLHQATVAAAAEKPPTIDALYSIYWPDCAVVGRNSFQQLAGQFAIPDEVTYLGLFTNAAQPARSSLAEVVGKRLGSASRRTPPHRAGPSPFQHTVFFGADGVIIPGQRRDELDSAESHHRQTE